jgi:predicted GNAT family acetyltransferase
MKYDDIELVDNKAIRNFEFVVEGHRSFIEYELKGKKIYLVHTEVPEELEGQGVAEAMVEKAFAYIEQHDMLVVPLCAYINLFLQRHPEWDRLVA